MQDLSYDEALERAEPPHEVLLGPVPCGRCGAMVEWAGVQWLAIATTEPHDCWPYLRATSRPPMAHRVVPPPRSYGAQAQPVVPAWMERSEPALWLAVGVLVVLAILAALWPASPGPIR